MLIAYASKTGNVRRFVDKLQLRTERIEAETLLNEPFILITYTTGFGQVPEAVRQFLSNNYRWLRGVSASGNRNWGTSFAKSADTISEQYRVPIVSKFELSGTGRDVEHFMQGVNGLAAY